MSSLGKKKKNTVIDGGGVHYFQTGLQCEMQTYAPAHLEIGLKPSKKTRT